MGTVDPSSEARALAAEVLAECQSGLPGWRGFAPTDFSFAPPKGFSSFTMVVQALDDPSAAPPNPRAVLYRRLAGKENAILSSEAERAVFLRLSEAKLSAPCLHYAPGFRLEGFYDGRTLTADDVFDREILAGLAAELHRFHRLPVDDLIGPVIPERGFFELLVERWTPLARRVLVEQRDRFPENERPLCEPLMEIIDESTSRKVARCIPEGPLTFCHNDTYHGNVMRLRDGRIRLLDFEFSCLNHPAFDFANFFAETVMVHGLSDPPYFGIAEPRFGDTEIGWLVDAYLSHSTFPDADARSRERQRLVDATRDLVMLSDYMYAMAALPLSVEPIQKIRFLPYAAQRFQRFSRTWEARFGA